MSSVSLGAEVLYYRLLTQTDDGGNFFFDSQIIWGRCFPLRRDTTAQMVNGWRDELVKAELLSEYSHGDEKYVHFNRFGDFQFLRSDRNPDIRYPVAPGAPVVHQSETKQETERQPQAHHLRPESKLIEENRSTYVRSDPVSVFVELRRQFRRKIGKSIGSLGRREYEWNGAVERNAPDAIYDAAQKWMQENKEWLKDKCTLPIWNFLDRLSEYIEAASIECETPNAAPPTEEDDGSITPEDIERDLRIGAAEADARRARKVAAK